MIETGNIRNSGQIAFAEKEGNILKYSPSIKCKPVERIEQLRKLFVQIGADEKNMAVLKKAN